LTEIKEYDENKLETKILRKNGSLGINVKKGIIIEK